MRIMSLFSADLAQFRIKMTVRFTQRLRCNLQEHIFTWWFYRRNMKWLKTWMTTEPGMMICLSLTLYQRSISPFKTSVRGTVRQEWAKILNIFLGLHRGQRLAQRRMERTRIYSAVVVHLVVLTICTTLTWCITFGPNCLRMERARRIAAGWHLPVSFFLRHFEYIFKLDGIVCCFSAGWARGKNKTVKLLFLTFGFSIKTL